jgi:hypothetical protein
VRFASTDWIALGALRRAMVWVILGLEDEYAREVARESARWLKAEVKKGLQRRQAKEKEDV